FLATSTPSFFIALVLLYLFSVKLQLLPIGGMYTVGTANSFLSLLAHLIMPCLVLSFHMMGTLIQFTRSSMLEVMREDYVRTAKAKGLQERVLIVRHVLRNSLIPVATYLGMEIPLLLGGAVVTEQVFSWPGIGKLMIQSISARDYPVIMGVTVLVALAVLIFNLITDLVYGLLDPRIRYD
ncbi:ABC transporter permease, partial [Paenibacillus riograndensis]